MWNQIEREFDAADQELTLRIPNDGLDYVLVTRLTGTFTATVQVQESTDDGDSFSGATSRDTGGTAGDPSDEDVHTTVLSSGADYVKLKTTSYTSGAARAQALLVPKS